MCEILNQEPPERIMLNASGPSRLLDRTRVSRPSLRRSLCIATRLSVCGACLWGMMTILGCQVCCTDLIYWLMDYNFYPVSEGKVYRSRQPDAALLQFAVRDMGVRTVINLRGENTGEEWYDAEVACLRDLGAALVDIRMSATEPPEPNTLLQLYETFLTAEYPILIHCQAGADRTGAASAIWRMMVAGDSREEALKELNCRFGHYREFTPAMDWLAEVFVPDVNWIMTKYDPNAFWNPHMPS